MPYEVVRVVTQPCHGPGGELIHDVGEQLPSDGDAPDGVRFTLSVIEVPDSPKRASKAAAAGSAAAGSAAAGA